MSRQGAVTEGYKTMSYGETWFWMLLGAGVFFVGMHVAARMRDPSHRFFDW